MLQRAVLADFHLPVGAVAESQAANVTQLIERLRIATPRQEPEFAIGQWEEGGRGTQKGDGERFGSTRQAKGTVDQGSPHPHRGKEMYPKNSLPVTEHPCAIPSDCQNAFHDSSPAHNFTTSRQQRFLSSPSQFISPPQWGAFAIPMHFEPVL